MSGQGTAPRPCPFCGARLQWQEENFSNKFHPVFGIWKHPYNGCYAEGFAVVPQDVQKWNRRAER